LKRTGEEEADRGGMVIKMIRIRLIGKINCYVYIATSKSVRFGTVKLEIW